MWKCMHLKMYMLHMLLLNKKISGCRMEPQPGPLKFCAYNHSSSQLEATFWASSMTVNRLSTKSSIIVYVKVLRNVAVTGYTIPALPLFSRTFEMKNWDESTLLDYEIKIVQYDHGTQKRYLDLNWSELNIVFQSMVNCGLQ